MASACVLAPKCRMVMSSIMRRRSGLTASLLMGAPVRDGGGPTIFGQATPGRSPHLQYWPPLPRERFSPWHNSDLGAGAALEWKADLQPDRLIVRSASLGQGRIDQGRTARSILL